MFRLGLKAQEESSIKMISSPLSERT